MAETFSEAMVYALGCIGKADITLKEEQSKAVRYALNGEDTFVWLPTDFGKSICYECLPFVFDFTLGHNMQSADNRSFCVRHFFERLRIACAKAITAELMDISGLWDLNEKKVKELLYLLVFVWSPRSEV